MSRARQARRVIQRARAKNLASRTTLDAWMSDPVIKNHVRFSTRIEAGRLIFSAHLEDAGASGHTGAGKGGASASPAGLVEFRTEPRVVERPYDFGEDWNAWRGALEARGRGLFPSGLDISPSEDALLAVQIAAERHWQSSDFLQLTATTVSLAADLTAYFGAVDIGGVEIQPYRGDILIESLNRYAHSESGACRWLVPAIRNLAGLSREEPSELWSRWRDEEERHYRLSLHPRSTIFQGSPDPHNLIDYELDSHRVPISRSRLHRWRIRAHLFDLPKEWKFEQSRCVEGRPRLSPARLNALTMYAAEALRYVDTERSSVEPTVIGFRLYLLESAAESSLPMAERRRYKKALARLNEASEYNLLRRAVFTLDYYHIREYRTLLCGIEMEWRGSKAFTRRRRQDVRMKFLTDRGWAQTAEIDRLLGGRAPWECLPREIAGLLVSMREDLQPCHPQTFAEALATARKVYPEEDPVPASGKRRGRPARPPAFSPSTPSSD